MLLVPVWCVVDFLSLFLYKNGTLKVKMIPLTFWGWTGNNQKLRSSPFLNMRENNPLSRNQISFRFLQEKRLKIMRFCNFIWLLFVLFCNFCLFHSDDLTCVSWVCNQWSTQTNRRRERGTDWGQGLWRHTISPGCVCALFLSLSLPILCCAFRECRRVKVCHHYTTRVVTTTKRLQYNRRVGFFYLSLVFCHLKLLLAILLFNDGVSLSFTSPLCVWNEAKQRDERFCWGTRRVASPRLFCLVKSVIWLRLSIFSFFLLWYGFFIYFFRFRSLLEWWNLLNGSP